ncbi:hypothetical protein KKE68_00765 [Patescibacteria group bacterium]|nr:hypothetical protein [Patescibacteria group bacterium]
MKQKKPEPNTITKDDLKFLLNNLGDKLRTELNNLGDKLRTELNNLGDKLRTEFKEEFRKYRDENMTRLDEVMGELQAIREDNTIGTYQIRELRTDVDEHEKKIKKIEKTHEKTHHIS